MIKSICMLFFMTVLVNVHAADEVAPVIESGQVISYAENQSPEAKVGTVKVKDDVDAQVAELRFTKTGTKTSLDGYFSINENGEMFITQSGAGSSANNFEQYPISLSYELTARDKAGNSSSAVNVVLTKTDGNEANVGLADVKCTTIGQFEYHAGTRLKLLVDVVGFYEYPSMADATKKIANRGLVFKIDSESEDYYFGHFDDDSTLIAAYWDSTHAKGSEDDEYVKFEKQYLIKKTDIACVGKNDSSWVHGLLVVPFKFYKGDHSMTPESTVGYYIGKAIGAGGLRSTFVIGGGLASVSIPVAKEDGTAENVNKTAFSLAAGFLFKFLDNSDFEVGVFAGRDFVDGNAGLEYEHDGDTWYSLSFGYNFSN